MGSCAGKGQKEKAGQGDGAGHATGPQVPASRPPPPPEPNLPTFIAKFDYDCRTDDDLSFKKGDLLYIISTEEGDWWYARHRETGLDGYVPSNYIAEWKSLEAEE